MPHCPLNIIFMAYGKLLLINVCSYSGCKFLLRDISLHEVFIQLITFLYQITKLFSQLNIAVSLENLMVPHPVKKYAAFCHNS